MKNTITIRTVITLTLDGEGSPAEVHLGHVHIPVNRGVEVALNPVPEDGWMARESKAGNTYFQTKNVWSVDIAFTDSGYARIDGIEDTGEEPEAKKGGINLPTAGIKRSKKASGNIPA